MAATSTVVVVIITITMIIISIITTTKKLLLPSSNLLYFSLDFSAQPSLLRSLLASTSLETAGKVPAEGKFSPEKRLLLG